MCALPRRAVSLPLALSTRSRWLARWGPIGIPCAWDPGTPHVRAPRTLPCPDGEAGAKQPSGVYLRSRKEPKIMYLIYLV